MAQRIAVEEYEAARRDLNRAWHDGGALLARVQLVVEPAGRVVDDAEKHRIAAAGIVRSIVVPADVIARASVEIQRVGVRVIRRRGQQTLARNAFERVDQRARAIKLSNERRTLINDVPANAASLFVAGQIVAVDRFLQGGDSRCEALRGLRRQELRQEKERAVLDERASQRLEPNATRKPDQTSPVPDGPAASGFNWRAARR